jgi:hypothetical protein
MSQRERRAESSLLSVMLKRMRTPKSFAERVAIGLADLATSE